MVQNLGIQLIDVLIVVEMEKLDPTKDFLQFNKHVLNVLVVEKKSQIHVMIAVEVVTNKLQRKYLWLFLKVSMTELE